MNAALICRGPNWLSDLRVCKAPADLEIGFMPALETPGKAEALGLLLWEADSPVSLLSLEFILPSPHWSPFFTVTLFLILVTNSPQLGGNTMFATEMFLKFKKNGNLKARTVVQKHLSFCSFQLELLLF